MARGGRITGTRPAGRGRPLGITLEGPFFVADPAKTFRQNIRVLMDAVASTGESEVRRRIVGGGREGAHTARHVVGRTRNLSGRRWAVTAVISVSTADLATGTRNPAAMQRMAIAAGRHTPVTARGRRIGTTLGAEGRTHAFRATRRIIMRIAREHAADLVEGLN